MMGRPAHRADAGAHGGSTHTCSSARTISRGLSRTAHPGARSRSQHGKGREMPKDGWSEDRVQREIALQERSDAVAADTTPTINALAPLPNQMPDAGAGPARLGRLVGGQVPREAAALIASGDYRPFMATEGYTDSGPSRCQADPEWVEFGRKERVTLRLTRSGAPRPIVERDGRTHLVMSDEEMVTHERAQPG